MKKTKSGTENCSTTRQSQPGSTRFRRADEEGERTHEGNRCRVDERELGLGELRDRVARQAAHVAVVPRRVGRDERLLEGERARRLGVVAVDCEQGGGSQDEEDEEGRRRRKEGRTAHVASRRADVRAVDVGPEGHHVEVDVAAPGRLQGRQGRQSRLEKVEKRRKRDARRARPRRSRPTASPQSGTRSTRRTTRTAGWRPCSAAAPSGRSGSPPCAT